MISNSIASFAITLLLTASTAAFGEDFSSPGGGASRFVLIPRLPGSASTT